MMGKMPKFMLVQFTLGNLERVSTYVGRTFNRNFTKKN